MDVTADILQLSQGSNAERLGDQRDVAYGGTALVAGKVLWELVCALVEKVRQ